MWIRKKVKLIAYSIADSYTTLPCFCRPNRQSIGDSVKLVGGVTVTKLSSLIANDVIRRTQRLSITQYDTIQVFYRAEVNGQLFYSMRVKARNSFTVEYHTYDSTQSKFGFILYFFIAKECVFAVINKLNIHSTKAFAFTVGCRSVPVSVSQTNLFDVVEVTFLLEKVLFIEGLVIRFPQACTWLIQD